MLLYCRHCIRNVAVRPRRLCYRCYQDRAIRKLYRPLTRNGWGPARHRVPLPASPTRALPGSWAKVTVLEKRASERVQLFHPEDA